MQTIVPAGLAGERVDRAVALVTGLSRAAVAELLAVGAVRLDGGRAKAASARVTAGQVLEVEMPVAEAGVRCPPDFHVEVPIVYLDEDVIVVDKPAELVVHPGAGHSSGTLVQGLLARFPELGGVGEPSRPGIVHRLDKGTSGLRVVARSSRAHASLVAQLTPSPGGRRSAERRYLALVRGHLQSTRGIIDAPVGRAERDRTRMAVSSRGRQARTHYCLRQAFTYPQDFSLLECGLETGRTHQIRVHLAAIGHPVMGDVRYRGSPRFGLSRPFLHAWALAFDHPSSGERMQFESQLPFELERVLSELG